MRTRFITMAAISAILITAAFSEDFWVKKSYHKWSKEETHKMLTDSPFAKTIRMATATLPTEGSLGAGTIQQPAAGVPPAINRGFSDNPAEGEPAPDVSYTVQLRSAAPIREALVRQSEIAANYDLLPLANKAKIDANADKFLAATFPDRILVCVVVSSNVQGYVSQLRSYWAAQSVAKLSMTTYLNVGSEKLSLIGYGFKDDTIQFVFPRPKNLAADETLTLEFIHPTIQRLYEQRMMVSFHTKKMEINGQPAL